MSNGSSGSTARPSTVKRFVIGSLILIWVGGFLWLQTASIIESYQHLGLLDLQVYRMGGRAILDHSLLYEAVYPWNSLGFTYSPFAAVLFIPLAVAGWAGGAAIITAASIVATVRVGQLLVRQLDGQSSTTRRRVAVVALCVAVSLWSLRSTLEFGQINLVVMWLVVEDFLGFGSKRRWSGVLLGLAIGIKLTPFVFLGLLLWSRQWRRLMVACAVFASTVVIGFAVQPQQAWLYWTEKVFDPSRVGDVSFAGNQSLEGVIVRSFGRPMTALWVLGAGVIFVAVSRIGAQLWGQRRHIESVTLVGLGGLLISPISWAHHWVWLLPAAAVLAVPDPFASTLRRQVRRGLLAATVICGSVRIQTLLSPGADPWTNPNAADRVIANLLVLLNLWIMVFVGFSARSPAQSDGLVAAVTAADGPGHG